MIRTYPINGVNIDLYDIKELALAIGKRPVTIRLWERLGWIPVPKYHLPTKNPEIKGRRLYTLEEIELLKRIVQEENIVAGKSVVKTNFIRKVKDGFAKLRGC